MIHTSNVSTKFHLAQMRLMLQRGFYARGQGWQNDIRDKIIVHVKAESTLSPESLESWWRTARIPQWSCNSAYIYCANLHRNGNRWYGMDKKDSLAPPDLPLKNWKVGSTFDQLFPMHAQIFPAILRTFLPFNLALSGPTSWGPNVTWNLFCKWWQKSHAPPKENFKQGVSEISLTQVFAFISRENCKSQYFWFSQFAWDARCQFWIDI